MPNFNPDPLTGQRLGITTLKGGQCPVYDSVQQDYDGGVSLYLYNVDNQDEYVDIMGFGTLENTLLLPTGYFAEGEPVIYSGSMSGLSSSELYFASLQGTLNDSEIFLVDGFGSPVNILDIYPNGRLYRADQLFTVGCVGGQFKAGNDTVSQNVIDGEAAVGAQSVELMKLNNSSYISYSFWVKPLDPSISLITCDRLSISLSAANKLVVGSFTSISSLTLNEWTHVGIVFNGDKLLVYINGVQDSAHDLASLYTMTSYTLSTYSNMRDVRIYDRPLFLSEVQKLASSRSILEQEPNNGNVYATWFDGSTYGIHDMNQIDSTQPHWVSVWVNRDAAAAIRARLFTNIYGWDYSGVEVTEYPIFTNAGSYYMDSYKSLPDGTWVHLMTSYNGTTATLWINGEPDITMDLTGEVINAYSTGVWCGRFSTYYFTGYMFDARLGQGILTENLAKDVYSGKLIGQEVSRYLVTANSTIFEDTTGSNSGTWSGTPQFKRINAIPSSNINNYAISAQPLRCREFDGATQSAQVSIPNITSYPFTLCARYKVDAAVTGIRVALSLGQAGSSVNYFTVGWSSGNIRISRRDTGGEIGTTLTPLNTEEWATIIAKYINETDVAVSINGSPFVLYVGSSVTCNTLNEVRLGLVRLVSPTQYWDGFLSSCSVYSRALSDQEAWSVHNNVYPQNGLVLGTFLNSTHPETEWDFSGNNLHFSLNNRPNVIEDTTLQVSTAAQHGYDNNRIDIYDDIENFVPTGCTYTDLGAGRFQIN